MLTRIDIIIYFISIIDSQSASLLERESECKLESQAVAQFREGVMKGDWDLVERLLPTLELDQSKDAVVKL